MRRAHPIVYIAVWAAVTLLAVAGFAAFQIQERDVPRPTNAALGRQVGAMAGLGFSAPRAQVTTAVVDSVETEDTNTTELTAEALLTEDEGTESEDKPLDTIPSNGWLSEMQMRALVSKYFRSEDVNRAIRTAWCRSHFNPTSTDPATGAVGLFHQLPEFWEARAEAAGFGGTEPTDPEANVAAAAQAVYEEGGWSVFPCP